MQLLRILLVLLLAPALADHALAQPRFSLDATPGKLPKDVVPLAYTIDLVPDLDRFAAATGTDDVPFDGAVDIDIQVRRPVSAVVLNAANLQIAHATVDGTPAEVTADARRETVTLAIGRVLGPGPYKLSIRYTGRIGPQPEGLFYTLYDTPTGKGRALATDLQPVFSRRIFPNWDEPAFRATFALSIVVPANFRATSNMPVLREEAAGADRKKVTFATTPRMSTYILALVAGEFGRIGGNVGGVDVGVVVPPHLIEQARHAHATAIKVIGFYTDYFGSRYPLPKLDNILIPGNYNSAMENWGAATYDVRSLLFDPATSTQDAREHTFEIVAHEIAHQWFGNLVTNAWWDDLWLNEGFATWMQKKVADHFNPSWKTWLHANRYKERALAADALRTAHSVQQPVEDDSLAMAAFDDITYQKGMSIVRMLEAYLGETVFRDGIRRYLKTHAYSNATTADLWAALEAVSKRPVARIAAGFVQQPGVPLIQASTRCDGGRLTATLRQERFTLNDPYAARQSWVVPVSLGRPGNAKASHVVLVEGPPTTVSFEGCDLPVKANFGDVGYFRVQYDDAAFRHLASFVDRLPAVDRVNLVADTWAMVLAGRIEPASYLDLVSRMSGETEPAVWETMIENFRTTDDLLAGSPGREGFRVHARKLIRPLLERLGWQPRPDESLDHAKLRALAIAALGRLRDPETTAEARRRFTAMAPDRNAVPKDLREPIAKAVAYAADRSIYGDLLRLAHASSSAGERLTYYMALAGAGEPELVGQTVALVADDPDFPREQVANVLERAAHESGDPQRVFRLAFEQRQAIFSHLSELSRQSALPDIARFASDPEVAFQLRWAREVRASPGARRKADETAELIEAQADLKQRLVPAVDAWLKANPG
jgi:aminopeptidase N